MPAGVAPQALHTLLASLCRADVRYLEYFASPEGYDALKPILDSLDGEEVRPPLSTACRDDLKASSSFCGCED